MATDDLPEKTGIQLKKFFFWTIINEAAVVAVYMETFSSAHPSIFMAIYMAKVGV